MAFPTALFTEPSEVDPDTLANLGPLGRLAGTWEGTKGVDLNPKAEGPERREFRERIVFEPSDAQANGPQLIYGLRYHIHINTAEEDITFHDQVGYWLREPATGLVLQPIAIPRGQVEIAFKEDGSWRYVINCELVVRGQAQPFQHRDENHIVKVAEPEPNPLMKILAAR